MAGTSRSIRVLATFLVLSALTPLGFPAASSHGDECVEPGTEFTRHIVAPNPLHEHVTATEVLVLVASPVSPVAFDNLAQDVDAAVIDLGCDSVGAGFSLVGDDDGNDLYELRVRFYDDDVGLLGQTACGKELSGALPNGSHYMAIVPCGGMPVGLYGLRPYSVEATLVVTH